MQKLIIKEGQCIGCGACVSIDPDHFDFNDEGTAIVTSNENLDTPELQMAIDACPTNAIVLKDCQTGEKCAECEKE